MVPRFDEGTNGGWSSVKDGDTVLLDDIPEATEVGMIGSTFIHDLSHAIGERSVGDVGMAGDPTDVGGTPVNIVILHVENIFAGGVSAGEVTAGGVKDSLGFSCRSGGVENEKRVLAVESFGFMLCGNLGCFVVPVNIAPALHGDFVPDALMNNDGIDRFVFLECFVDVGFQRNDSATAVTSVGGDNGLGFTVGKSIHNRLGREPTKHDRMNSSNASAGQHRDDRFRDHGHVDQYAVLGLDALREQDVGKLANLAVKLAVGEGAGLTGFTLPNNGGFVGPAIGEVTIDAVFADVEFSADKPLGVRGLPVERFGPLFLPG